MKTSSLAGLVLLTQLYVGCVNDPKYDTQSKANPDSIYIQNDTTKYASFNGIKVDSEKEHLPLAKLINVTPHMVNLRFINGNTSFNDEYFILTFQVNDKFHTLYSRLGTDYIRGKNYDVSYWKFFDKMPKTDIQIFNAFVDGSDQYRGHLSKKLDSNLEGVIIEMKRIDGDGK
jgi:hypothetical protein